MINWGDTVTMGSDVLYLVIGKDWNGFEYEYTLIYNHNRDVSQRIVVRENQIQLCKVLELYSSI